MTSNLGGGGQTVSRLPPFLPLIGDLSKRNIGILLNYHYLTFYKKEGERKTERMVFDTKKLDQLNSERITFKKFFDRFEILNIEKFLNKNQINSNSDFEILLDSGSGKILADSVLYYDSNLNTVRDLIFNLVDHQIDFAEEKGTKYLIAMDFCKKNTYKNEEGRSIKYSNIIDSLLSDQGIQNKLLLKTLELAHQKKSKLKIFAPIHGQDHDDFLNHYNSIIELERQSNYNFSGFALGGLGSLSAGKIGMIVKEIRQTGEQRDLHILGSSGISKLPVLISAGANFFDCHTPWRRANDGDSKFCMPLLNSKLEIINDSTDSFINKPSAQVNTNNYDCDCPICLSYSHSEIEKLLKNRPQDTEGYYFAKLLIYFHGVYQYSYLMEKIELVQKNNTIDSFIGSIDNIRLRDKLRREMELIQ